MIRLALDIGSETVDAALSDGTATRLRKVPIAGRAPAVALRETAQEVAAEAGLGLSDLADIRVGSTGAVNTMLARRGARIALLTTRGFGDCLWLGRQNRAELYAPVARSPAPTFLLPRDAVREIDGRLDAEGHEVEPLDLPALEALAAELAAEGFEAVAVCLLFSHRDPAQERQVREVFARVAPGLDVALSHEVDPRPREYERTVSACLEAWLRPSIRATLDGFREGLAAGGFAGDLHYALSDGALASAGAVGAQLSSLLGGGIAAAALRGAQVAAQLGTGTAIALDIGGASTDVTLIRAGRVETCRGSTVASVPIRQDMVDLGTGALGGGSRAARDASGGIIFRPEGPEGARLDAALMRLGLVPAEPPAAEPGAPEDARIVEAAVRRVARDVLDFAARRNLDPADATLIVMGGLGAVLGPRVAALLSMRGIACAPGHACAGALGLLSAQLSVRAERTVNLPAGALETEALGLLRDELVRRAAAGLPANAEAGRATREVSAEMALTPHMHPIRVPLDPDALDGGALAAAFAKRHDALYGIEPAGAGHVMSLAVSLRLEDDAPPPSPEAPASDLPAPGDGWVRRDRDGIILWERQA